MEDLKGPSDVCFGHLAVGKPVLTHLPLPLPLQEYPPLHRTPALPYASLLTRPPTGALNPCPAPV